MSLPGIKLVTFDVTNTLLQFRKPPWEYYASVAHEFGFKGDGKSIKNKFLNNYKVMTKQHPNFGKNTISWQQWWSKIIYMTFQGDLPLDSNIDIISKKLIEDYKTTTCWQIAEGSEDLIKILKHSKITIGVISNFDPRLHEILSNLNLNKYFDFVLTSYDIGFSKPDKKIFEIARMRSKNTEPSQCLHIGDDICKDYKGAKDAGWHALLISNKLQVIESEIMNKTFSNLKELIVRIEKNDIKLLH